jgi:hypothetical protein
MLASGALRRPRSIKMGEDAAAAGCQAAKAR